jgi:hypothetical protein
MIVTDMLRSKAAWAVAVVKVAVAKATLEAHSLMYSMTCLATSREANVVADAVQRVALT